MYYANIKDYDIANGEGVRISLFVSGCRNHCPNCFQPETWDFDYGTEFTEFTLRELCEKLKPDYINGLTILGGEPMEPENQRALTGIVSFIKSQFPEKTIWLYTGFTYEDLYNPESRGHCEITDSLLSDIDVLVDGPFKQELHDISLVFRGSSNQRVIDMKKTRETGSIVTLNL